MADVDQITDEEASYLYMCKTRCALPEEKATPLCKRGLLIASSPGFVPSKTYTTTDRGLAALRSRATPPTMPPRDGVRRA